MTIAYICVDPDHDAARKAVWEPELTETKQWTTNTQLTGFEQDWEDLCQCPVPPRDVTLLINPTEPGNLASIVLKIATSAEVPSEKLLEITFKL